MKKIGFFIITGLMLVSAAKAQQLSQVNFSNATTLSYFTFIIDGNLHIRISDDGRILEWGTEQQSIRNSNYYSPQLQPYPGRLAYYGKEADSVSVGKVKTIGSAEISYYGKGELPFRIGKIRSINSQLFDYFNTADNKALTGKIKNMSILSLDFYPSYENVGFAGKLKSVGGTAITYYSSFDDKLIKGKIKAIGSNSYNWYTSFDLPGYGGGLKSGLLRLSVNGVLYVIQ
jgi:hypothetical protein